MNKRLFFGLIFLLSLVLSACSGRKANVVGINKMEKAKGDSAIYGLASVGCSDSVLMLLP